MAKVINIEREHLNFSSVKLYQCHWVENHPFVDKMYSNISIYKRKNLAFFLKFLI